MGRLIDVDVLRDELKMHVDREDGHVLQEEFETVMFFVDCYSKTADPTTLWIPVTERLPEWLESVIVHYENGVVRLAMLHSENRFSHEGLYGKVTHWMPLPEPPVGDSPC